MALELLRTHLPPLYFFSQNPLEKPQKNLLPKQNDDFPPPFALFSSRRSPPGYIRGSSSSIVVPLRVTFLFVKNSPLLTFFLPFPSFGLLHLSFSDLQLFDFFRTTPPQYLRSFPSWRTLLPPGRVGMFGSTFLFLSVLLKPQQRQVYHSNLGLQRYSTRSLFFPPPLLADPLDCS